MKSPTGNIVVTIESLLAKKGRRKEGFMDACKGNCVKWDEATGLVEFTEKQRDELKEKYLIGMGERLHGVAGPIGRDVGWPCMKGDGTTDLKPNSPCAKIKNGLDSLTRQATTI